MPSAWNPIARKNGSITKAQISVFGIYDASGQPISLLGVVHDITVQLCGEEERQRLQEEVIAAQQAALRELRKLVPPAGFEPAIFTLKG